MSKKKEDVITGNTKDGPDVKERRNLVVPGPRVDYTARNVDNKRSNVRKTKWKREWRKMGRECRPPDQSTKTIFGTNSFDGGGDVVMVVSRKPVVKETRCHASGHFLNYCYSSESLFNCHDQGRSQKSGNGGGQKFRQETTPNEL